MKLKLISAVAFLFSLLTFGQNSFSYGSQFDVNTKYEKNFKLSIADSNGYFMSSNITETGSEKIYLRKFDKNNNLVDTFVKDFPKMDRFAFVNYLGSIESNGKICFFAENYAGKLKKKEFHKIVFDKTTSTFTDTLLASYTIESAMKSGNSDFQVSENGRFGALVYYQHSARKEPSKISIIAIENGSFNQAWKKDLSITTEGRGTDFVVTNSGNVSLLRIVAQTSMMLYVTPKEEEEKFFSEKMIVNAATAVSMGTKEYLVAFNAIKKSVAVNPSVVENIMLYDMNEGKIIANNPTNIFNKKGTLQEIKILYTQLSSDKISVFTESKVEAGKRKVGAFEEKIYKLMDPTISTINISDGSLSFYSLSNNFEPEVGTYNTFGLVNVKGNLVVKSGSSDLSDIVSYQLDPIKGIAIKANSNKDPFYGTAINQALIYNTETKQLIFPRILSENKMSIVSLNDFTGK